MSELVTIREELNNETVFLEEFLDGEICYLLSLWDGKNLLSFPLSIELTEVQEDRLALYKTKLNFLLSDEKADFIGFFVTKLIWSRNDWFVLEHIMRINDCVDLNINRTDFLMILNSAIYQKLSEISF